MLLRELIEIPEKVHKGDFVLKLTEGVDHADETLRSYVATPELVANFTDALGFIRSAVQSGSSKATYLDGSFGSGKSHFMAVLHLLLQGHPKARAIPELAPVVIASSTWMDGRKFLLLPYHMIGAASLESAILGRYVERIRELHPDAPVPGVFIAGSLFQDAERTRRAMGDDRFFAELSSAARASSSGWGDFEQEWNAERFAAAITAAPSSEEHSQLVGDLIATLFTSYATAMQGNKQAFVPIDDGLAIISRHARDLGYDAVVLFLDELILWLASHAADTGFVNAEIQKVAKLVEAQHADRPIPIISFVARQRDLRELIGDHVPGAEQLAFADTLKWWEGRLHKIGLLDRNLPAIAEKRLLRPISEKARAEIDGAFSRLQISHRDVFDILTTEEADLESFRKVYPFSPALVATLVAVSSLLQRERTAIKVMLQLLVNQRESLELGDVVPVGDLFDVVAEGDEAFSDVMRQQFDNAKRLYRQKLLPLIEAEHKISAMEARALPHQDKLARAFRADDRLAKTLLLSAIAPEVAPLRSLTPQRLVALNHGSIRSPIAGRESQMVLAKLRSWAAAIGEIRLADDSVNPTVTVQLAAVDTDSILEKAKVVDNYGERLRKIRALVFGELGVAFDEELFSNHSFTWHNTTRECDVLFSNVRELPEASLQAKGDGWKVVIDFPFDTEGFTPRDDIAKLQAFRDTFGSTRTIVWIPSFFTTRTMKDLGTLVVLDHVLTGDRFGDFATHLAPGDRLAAKSLLENQRSQLGARLREHLAGAYGITKPDPAAIDASHDLSEHVQSLDPTLRLQPPVGANLRDALQNLLAQALRHQFPAHPDFGAEIKSSTVKKVLAELETTLEDPQQRALVDKTIRPLMHQIAVPLDLGTMGETHFVLGDFWGNHFLRCIADDGAAVTVGKLREWTDRPQARGLPDPTQNLLILLFAARHGYTFRRHGGPAGETSIDRLYDDLELVLEAPPSAEDWAAANARVGTLFGLEDSPLRSAANAERLAERIRAAVAPMRKGCEQLCPILEKHLRDFGIEPKTALRLKTARAVQSLVESVIHAKDPRAIIAAVASARIETSAEAMGTSLRKATELADGLSVVPWELFDSVRMLADERRGAAEAITARVAESLAADEYAIALLHALKPAQSEAIRLLTVVPPTPPPPPPPPAGKVVVSNGSQGDLSPAVAREIFERLATELEQADTTLELTWTVWRKKGA